MSISVTELLGVRLRNWLYANAEGNPTLSAATSFWVEPMAGSEPGHAAAVKEGLEVLKSTRVHEWITHDSLVFIDLEDADGRKLCIGSRDGRLRGLPNGSDTSDMTDLHFLQLAEIATKYALAPTSLVPFALISSLPIFEEDILPYMPEVRVFVLGPSEMADGFFIRTLKKLLFLESDQEYVECFRDRIVELACVMPATDHDWMLEQLLAAVVSRRLTNFYLELYKLFEFFFPLNSIFKLADTLEFTDSEIKLLAYCRDSLSWNVNHQRGARSAGTFSSAAFAEVCLGCVFSGSQDQLDSFKDRAIEKLTSARHDLTHQYFRSVSIRKADLLVCVKALLVFLEEAFEKYTNDVKSRRAVQGAKPTRTRRASVQRAAKSSGKAAWQQS